MEELENFIGRETFSLMQKGIQISTLSIVQDQVHIMIFLHVVVELDDVGMFQLSVNSDLCPNIMKVRACHLRRVHADLN